MFHYSLRFNLNFNIENFDGFIVLTSHLRRFRELAIFVPTTDHGQNRLLLIALAACMCGLVSQAIWTLWMTGIQYGDCFTGPLLQVSRLS